MKERKELPGYLKTTLIEKIMLANRGYREGDEQEKQKFINMYRSRKKTAIEKMKYDESLFEDFDKQINIIN